MVVSKKRVEKTRSITWRWNQGKRGSKWEREKKRGEKEGANNEIEPLFDSEFCKRSVWRRMKSWKDK